MQGEAAKGVALTAYVVLSFLADKVCTTLNNKTFQIFTPTFQTIAQNYADVINKALAYVYQTLQTLDDVYSLSIAAYAAQLANYEHKDALLQKLDTLAKVKGNI